MPRPNSEWLTDDVSYFANLGVNLVVSHLENSEERELGLSAEKDTLNTVGIEFLSYPIEDRGLPDMNSFTRFLDEVYLKLVDGMHVSVHCRAGIGRTGLTSLVC